MGRTGNEAREISLTPGPGLLVVLEPVVELDPLGALHGDAVQEVLGEVTLVEAGLLHHLPLRDGVLVHVLLDGLGHERLVTAAEEEEERSENGRTEKVGQQNAETALYGVCHIIIYYGGVYHESPDHGFARVQICTVAQDMLIILQNETLRV